MRHNPGVPTILQRAAQSLLLFWLVVSLTFLLTRLAPGDPTELLIAPTASRQDMARLRESFGLDASLPAQYAQWLRRVATGDLGTSFATSERVSDVLRRSLPVSLALGGVSLLLVLGHFALPFLLLLSRDLKRHSGLLSQVAIAVLVMRLVETIWLVAPAFEAFSWLHVVIPVGLAGIWLFVFSRNLRQRALLPRNDPYFKELFAHEAH